MQDVFKYDYTANAIVPTGIRPQFTDHLADVGITRAAGGVRPMIVFSIVAIFVASVHPHYMALPGRRVSKQRLGIEREPREPRPVGRGHAGR